MADLDLNTTNFKPLVAVDIFPDVFESFSSGKYWGIGELLIHNQDRDRHVGSQN